jgi:hypothetical protein
VDSRFSEEDIMKKRRRAKLVYEGQYVAEVDVELIGSSSLGSGFLELSPVSLVLPSRFKPQLCH